MSAVPTPPDAITNMAEVLERLGNIPLCRVRFRPFPGTATEDDLLRVAAQEDRLCELVDGILVEKGMGFRESLLVAALAALLRAFVVPRNLGLVSGPDGTMRLFAGRIRIPDVAFISWARLPGGRVPTEAIPDLVSDLAVEVLSASNTPGEMARKRREYFTAGVCLVWEVDPEARTVAVYTAPDEPVVLTQDQTLDGGDVLPGFALPLREFFAELDRQGPAAS
ncbi:MAG: Uma2 family endonuclease [Planctomycetia bacterium]|nr:Uma2 family endonuclease [Planctomycetia bacterium]